MIQQLKTKPGPESFEALILGATKESPSIGSPDPDILLEMNSLHVAQTGIGILSNDMKQHLQNECDDRRRKGIPSIR